MADLKFSGVKAELAFGATATKIYLRVASDANEVILYALAAHLALRVRDPSMEIFVEREWPMVGISYKRGYFTPYQIQEVHAMMASSLKDLEITSEVRWDACNGGTVEWLEKHDIKLGVR